jgi:hypothetical protein
MLPKSFSKMSAANAKRCTAWRNGPSGAVRKALRTVEYMPEKERAAARPCRALRYVRVCHQLGMNYRFGY